MSSFKIFENELVVQHLLRHAVKEKNMMNSLSYRLLNKTFNSVCLQVIRKENRSLALISIKNHQDPGKPLALFLNHEQMTMKFCLNYIQFLDKVAKVKLDKLSVRHLYSIDESYKKILHSTLHNMIRRNRDKIIQFVGMKDFCPDGCDECMQVACIAEEYGPMQMNFLRTNLLKPKHFRVIWLTDSDLSEIASQLVETANSKEECMRLVGTVFPSNITCLYLCFFVFEPSYFGASLSSRETPANQSIPRELIEQFVKAWRVKVVHIVIDSFSTFVDSSKWSVSGYFTQFNWHSPPETMPISNFELEYLLIDASLGIKVSTHIVRRSENADTDVYDNLVVSSLRLFPSRKVQIGYNRYIYGWRALRKIMENSLHFLLRGSPSKILITFEIKLPERIDLAELNLQDPLDNGRFPMHITELSDPDQLVPGYNYNKRTLGSMRGLTATIEDRVTKCQVDFFMFTDSNPVV